MARLSPSGRETTSVAALQARPTNWEATLNSAMPMPDTLVREGPHTTLVHLVLSAQTAGQAGEVKLAFELYEANAVATKEKEKKDGLISEPNLGYVLRSVGQNPTDAQVKEFFVKYSKDGKV